MTLMHLSQDYNMRSRLVRLERQVHLSLKAIMHVMVQ